jgi:hypothetical protein
VAGSYASPALGDPDSVSGELASGALRSDSLPEPSPPLAPAAGAALLRWLDRSRARGPRR